MTMIELPDDLAAALKAKAEAQHLKLEDWFRTLADAPAGGNDLDRVFAEIRGLVEDADFSRNSGAVSVLDEMKALRARVKPDPEGWSTRDYVQYGRH